MTLAKGIFQASAIGSLTGILLAMTTIFWLNPGGSNYLPLLVALWWLVIFGSNLWHAYILSNKRMANMNRFGLQIVHAALAAAVYLGMDLLSNTLKPITLVGTTAEIHAGLSEKLDFALANSQLIVVVAFVLSLTTSGLLYSILSRPGAK